MENASAFELDALDTRIMELVTYARERGGEDRALLFRNLVDLFLTGKAPQKQPTRTQLLDVIEALMPHVEKETRRTTAELLAQMSHPPFDLAMRLVKDDPAVIGELLGSPVFDEDAIITIIQHTGRDHHQAIASRSDLSANVWIALARAAPKAPTYEKHASLSLWSEDLGTATKPFKSGATITPLHASVPEDKTSHAGRPETEFHTASWHNPEDDAPREQPSTTTDRAGSSTQRQAASLRILRTDNDLISERIEQNAIHMTARAHTVSKQTALAGYSAVSNQQNAQAATMAPITESDLVAWSWRSDRDGFVVNASQPGIDIITQDISTQSISMLDMLCLNTKVGHPVSRAFQRRSAIHDAPITLENVKEKHRFWTLEAVPVFSTNGGIFEGYQGVMTPIDNSEKDTYALNGTQDPSPTVFLNDANVTPTAREAIIDENIDRHSTPAAKVQPATASSRQSNDTLAKDTLAKDTLAKENMAKENMAKENLAEAAASAVKDVIAETLASMLNNTPSMPSSDKRPPPTSKLSEVEATLHLLEDAVIKLGETSQSNGGITARLQSEIATACIRSLKEQLAIEDN